MILLVVLMLSAKVGSGALTSTEDPEPPSGNLSEPLRAGAGGQAGGAGLGSPCVPAAPPWARQPQGAPGAPRFTRRFRLFFADTTQICGLFYS